MGPRIARKHVGWYLQEQDKLGNFKRKFNAIESSTEQLNALETYLNQL